MPNCPIPKLLTYNSLVNEIKKIDVGRVYSIQEEFSNDIDENESACSFLISFLNVGKRVASNSDNFFSLWR